jgi:RHS repeat-associated protein
LNIERLTLIFCGFALDDDYAVNYAYSSIGRFDTLDWAVGGNSHTATYAYVVNSDMISGYDVAAGANMFSTRKTYDPTRNLITMVSNAWNGVAISTFGYGNDAIGRRTSRIDDNSVTNAFGYNERSELTVADMGTNAFDYAYDAIGNRTSSEMSNLVSQIIKDYQSNPLNQYTNIANGVTNTPTYDADGNMLTHDGWTFTWNGENRLIAASNSTYQLTFAYDYLGRRFFKTSVSHALNTTNQAHFSYDGWNLISEESSETNLYIWGLDLSGGLQGAGGIGGLIASVSAGSVRFVSYDANGNVSDYTDDQGALRAHYEYDPFGNIAVAEGAEADDNPFRFSTKYFDSETGLSYYGYRYYLAELGRWPSRDPIGEAGGAGLFGFVANNAVQNIDPLGLKKIFALFVGDSITHMPMGGPFYGFKHKFLSKLTTDYPDDDVTAFGIGFPGAQIGDLTAISSSDALSDHAVFNKECDRLIVTYMIGINDVSPQSTYNIGAHAGDPDPETAALAGMASIAQGIYKGWHNGYLSIASTLNARASSDNLQSMFLYMNIASVTKGTGPRSIEENVHKGNFMVHKINERISRLQSTDASFTGNFQKRYVEVGAVSDVSYTHTGLGIPIEIDYKKYAVPGIVSDGLHYHDVGNDHIVGRLFGAIGSWLD